MTSVEIQQLAALCRCQFSPGSSAKSFVNRLSGYIVRPAAEIEAHELSEKETAFLDKLAHRYRKQIGKCLAVACSPCSPKVDPVDARVALDAFIEGRGEFGADIPTWTRAALTIYNAAHSTTFAHAYEYATKVAPSARRANTHGDIYCRFCGERLFVGVKQPHQLVKGNAEAQRHLTICALQLLAGMREPAQPGHRVLPMEWMW